jgi:hypothetical protein
MDLVELAPRVGPAGYFIDVAIPVQGMEPGIGICLKSALEVLQVSLRMLTLAILRIGKPDGWSGVLAGRPVVAHVRPEPGRPGLATAGRKHRDRRVVGMQLVACEHVLLNRVHQRREQLAGSAHPSGQG